MPNLFEREGHGLWVALREHIGAPLPKALANPMPATTHRYDDCKAPSKCPEHRRAYRRALNRRNEVTAREEQALITYRRDLANRERMHQVAQASRGSAVVDVDDL